MTGAPVNNVPILKVEIDDADFKAFQQTYAQFQKKVDELPGAWAKSDSVVASLQKRFEEMRNSADKQERAGGRAAGHAHSAGESAGTLTLSWADMYVTVRRVGTNVTGATRDLVKWERLTAVFSGLLGAGGLYGINKLAANVAARRMTAGGVGLTTGQSDAFRINYGRLGDTGRILQGIAEVSRDNKDQQPFASLGVDSRGKNPADLFIEVMGKIDKILDVTPLTRLGSTMRPYHLERLGMDENFLQLRKEMKPEERAELDAHYRRDEKDMAVPPEVVEAWTRFNTHIDGVKRQIWTVVDANLVNITPGLELVAGSLVDLLRVISEQKDGHTGTLLDEANGALLKFAKALDSDEGQKKLKNFMKKIEMSQKDFDRINQWLASHTTLLRYLAAAGAGAVAGSKIPVIGPLIGARGGAVLGVLGLAASDATDPLNPQQTSEERTRNAARVARARALNPSGSPSLTSGSPSEDRQSRARPTDAAPAGAHDTSFLTPRSRQELAGVNKELANSLLEASDESGIRFQVKEGRRTHAEANANAAKGIGVSNSQHLYGAAADLKMIDPKTGRLTRDRTVYEEFAQTFERVNRAKGNTQRWMGHSRTWSGDIPHFDQGLGYGQTHTPDPYGEGESAPAKAAALPTDAHNAPPARHGVHIMEGVPEGMTRWPQHPNRKPRSAQDVTVIDNTGGASHVEVAAH
jgi:hypothetical protein